jgi:hypothetical protein
MLVLSTRSTILSPRGSPKLLDEDKLAEDRMKAAEILRNEGLGVALDSHDQDTVVTGTL